MSRVGVRAILTPLLILLVCLALRRLVRHRTRSSAVLFGGLVGAGFYTYPAFWIVPGALLVVLLLTASFDRIRRRRSDVAVALVAMVSFLVVVTPLAHFAMTKPDYFFARAGDLSAELRFGDERARMLLDHLQRGLFMLHFRGDESPMYNIPGRPFLDPLTGVAFIAGLFVILKELPRQPVLHGALLCFWLLPLAPGAMTTAGAWGMRSIGSIPSVFLIAGIGLSRLTRRPIPWSSMPSWGSVLLLAFALTTIGILNYRAYFDEWANDPGVQGSYSADVLRFFDFCAKLASENDVYASPYVFNSPNFRFLELEHSSGLRLLDGVGDLTIDSGSGRSRVFISDFPVVTSVIKATYPKHEQIGRYSVWGHSNGVIIRVPKEQLKAALSDEELVEADYWISRMNAEFEVMTRAW
jgi:hypothetical protein